ncbi:MAG: hypothetical protein L7F77_02830 [Candidatus Magnetominusculus sp. LBB02]|nr:hypothetical protein [Candidatus Magnetominusculus sp. LBB02]
MRLVAVLIIIAALCSCSYVNEFVNPFGLDKENPLGSIAKLDDQIRLLLAVERVDSPKNVYKYKGKKTGETITIEMDEKNKILLVSAHIEAKSSDIKSFFIAYWRKVNGTDAAPRQVQGGKSPCGDSNFDRADLSTDAATGVWYICPNTEELEIAVKGNERLPRG